MEPPAQGHWQDNVEEIGAVPSDERTSNGKSTCPFNHSKPDGLIHLDIMVYALSKFVSIPSVSSDPAHREDCRQAAIWLKKCLSQLGAEATLVSLVFKPEMRLRLI